MADSHEADVATDTEADAAKQVSSAGVGGYSYSPENLFLPSPQQSSAAAAAQSPGLQFTPPGGETSGQIGTDGTDEMLKDSTDAVFVEPHHGVYTERRAAEAARAQEEAARAQEAAARAQQATANRARRTKLRNALRDAQRAMNVARQKDREEQAKAAAESGAKRRKSGRQTNPTGRYNELRLRF